MNKSLDQNLAAAFHCVLRLFCRMMTKKRSFLSQAAPLLAASKPQPEWPCARVTDRGSLAKRLTAAAMSRYPDTPGTKSLAHRIMFWINL